MERIVLQVGNFRTWRIRFVLVIISILLTAFTLVYVISGYINVVNQIFLGNVVGIITLVSVGGYVKWSISKPNGFYWAEFKDESVVIYRKRWKKEFLYSDIHAVFCQYHSYGGAKNEVNQYSVYIKSSKRQYRLDSVIMGETKSFDETDLYLFYKILNANWKYFQLKQLDKCV